MTAGCGRAQRMGGPIEEIRPGDVVWFPPGEKQQSDLASNDKLPSSCLVGALSYALINKNDVAYELANGCLDAGFSNTSVPGIVALWTPEMRSFRQDPRFQALATRLGLMDYWQQYGPPDECDLKDSKLACR